MVSERALIYQENNLAATLMHKETQQPNKRGGGGAVMEKTSPALSAAHVGTGSARSRGWAVPLSESAAAPD